MKFILQMALVAVLGYLMAFFLPWWNVAIAGFLASVLLRRAYWISFLGSFLGIFLLWFGAAMVISYSTGSPLPDRVAGLISPSLNGTGLAIVSGLVGGLVAGFAGIAGRALRGAPAKRR